jgi:branched-chain amino acid transport system substrate-binding protein
VKVYKRGKAGSINVSVQLHRKESAMKIRQGKIKMWCCQVLICLTVITMAGLVHSQETIKIGVIGPMRFDAGAEYWSAATLAQEEINAAGGVRLGNKKIPLELIKTDDNDMLSITDAVTAMERLITFNKVNFVVGGHRSEAVLAQQEVVADQKKVVWINCYTATPQSTERVAKQYDRYKYYFRLASQNSGNLAQIYIHEAVMVAGKVREKLGVAKPRVALMAEKVLWIDPIMQAANAKFPELGMEVVGTWRVSPTAGDLTAELTAIKNAGPHMIFYVGSGPVGIVAARQWGELKIPAALIGSNIPAGTDRIVRTLGHLVDYHATYSSFGYAQITPNTIAFMDKMKKRYGDTPTMAAQQYESVYVLKEAIERAGTLNTDAMVASVEKTDYMGVSGRIGFTPKGDPSNRVHDIMFGPKWSSGVVIQWKDGKPLVIWPDGKALLGDKSWEGYRHKGTVDYELPPWMVTYWKDKK